MPDRKSIVRIVALLLIIQAAIQMMNGSSMNFAAWIIYKLELLPGILLGLSFHEFGHAWMSNKLGDPTPKMQGRISLNPRHHLDPIGFLCLLLAGFGWGIPVQIDPRYYKHRRRDSILVGFAGVFMNLVLAVVFSIILGLVLSTPLYQNTQQDTIMGTISLVIFRIIYYTITINVVLMIFNLLPIPPLDGFGIITEIFNLRKHSWYYNVYQWGPLILVLFIMLDVTDLILSPLTSWVLNLLVNIFIY